MKLDVTALIQILTVLSLLAGLIIFAVTLFGKLNTLLSLPESVKRIELDLKRNTDETKRVAEASSRWRSESEYWHQRHMDESHRRR